MSLCAPTQDKDERYATAQRVSLLVLKQLREVFGHRTPGGGGGLDWMNSSKGSAAHIKSFWIGLWSVCERRAGRAAAFEAGRIHRVGLWETGQTGEALVEPRAALTSAPRLDPPLQFLSLADLIAQKA